MSVKCFTKKIDAIYDLDALKSRFERNISYVSDWFHTAHYGTRFLSKKEEELKDEILLKGINRLCFIINKSNEKISKKVKEIENDMFELFSDNGHNEREVRRTISVTCETAIRNQLEILAKSSSLGDKSKDIRDTLNNIQKVISEY